jgi:hypothetical protein
MSDDTGSDPVGSVADEATKLLRALQGWAQDNGSAYADATASAAAGAASTLHGVTEHVATGSEECRYCPVCQVISAVRGTPPEVRQHLAAAATSLMHAAAGVLATPVPGQSAARRDESMEKIDITDEPEED